MTDTIPIPRELRAALMDQLGFVIEPCGAAGHVLVEAVYDEELTRDASRAEVTLWKALLEARRSALTQQAEGVVPVAEAMGALIAAWNRLTKLHGWTRAWEPEPGDAGWIPAHEQMQRAINALISAQPSGEVLTGVRAHIIAAMDNDLGLADRMLQMDKARKLIDATLAKIGGKR